MIQYHKTPKHLKKSITTTQESERCQINAYTLENYANYVIVIRLKSSNINVIKYVLIEKLMPIMSKI